MFKKSMSFRQIIPLLAVFMVLNAEVINPSLSSIRINKQIVRKINDPEKIIYNGPSQNILLKLNIKFDPTLKHFRIEEIQQAECSGETEQIQEITTVVKTESKVVNQQKKEVKQSNGWKQTQTNIKVAAIPNVQSSNTIEPVLKGKPIQINVPKVSQSTSTHQIVANSAVKKTQKQEAKVVAVKPAVVKEQVKPIVMGADSRTWGPKVQNIGTKKSINTKENLEKNVQIRTQVDNPPANKPAQKKIQQKVISGANKPKVQVVSAPQKIVESVQVIKPQTVTSTLKKAENEETSSEKPQIVASTPRRVESEGSQGEGNQGEGSQNEGKQAEGSQNEGTPSKRPQIVASTPRRVESEGSQGEGNQSEGSQGEGSQSEGNQGEGSQKAGTNLSSQEHQGEGSLAPKPAKTSAWKIF